MNQNIKYGYHEPTGKVVHIFAARNGLSCQCRCFECNEKLEAVQGTKKEWHFRHNSTSSCKGGPETALHQLAKQIIVENAEIKLPQTILTYTNAFMEQRLGQFTPDVTVSSRQGKVYFEICVTHTIDNPKEQFYRNSEMKSIEIDLRQTARDITPEKLKRQLLDSAQYKRYIYWYPEDEQNAVSHKLESDNNLLRWICLIAAAAGFRYYFLRRRNW
ncbi:competence protein CoiA family protein [Flavobacterium sp. AG291]|uniref:competence protein CoiA family protein n=1 Tax=Flavobacterium sp. AG291 TaxID=2184000 RepID=UPI000E0B0EBD|nr:competence protein CoiA family protein [Flavobacterium sp. AG291]RDI11262.1 competence protein CoiA-like protein [Flavobacterium sp. AG291]